MSTLSALAYSVAAPFGLPLTTPFRGQGTAHKATLEFDPDARLPGRTTLLRAGARHDAFVRISPAGGEAHVRTVCVKIANAYGPGRDQDLLLASSADGAPLHHLTVPAARAGQRLYSSLWLYLAGGRPVLFGILPTEGRDAAGGGDHAATTGFGAGSVLPFAIAGPLGRFHPIGSIRVHAAVDHGVAASLRFLAANDGGGLRALPPTRFFREQG